MKAICEICGKKFKNQFALTGHKKIKNDALHRDWRAKNIDSNGLSEIQKSAVQPGMYSPEILKRAKELVEKEARDKIINEYLRITIQPKFVSGEWLNNDKLKSILAKKDEDHKLEIFKINASHNQEIKILEDLVEKLREENLGLKKEILQLNNYIENTLDDDVRRWQEEHKHKIEILNAEIKDFAGYKIKEQATLDIEKSEIKIRKKNLEKRENNVTKGEANLKEQKQKITELKKEFKIQVDKEKNEFNKKKTKIKVNQDRRKREIKNKKREQMDKNKEDQERIKEEWDKINKIKKELQSEGERLKKWEIRLNKETYEKSIENIVNYLHRLNLKNKQKKQPMLLPITYSEKPIRQSGFSSNIQSGVETKMVKSNAEPVIQSGSPIMRTGEKVKVVTSNSGPVIQSGISNNYYSGVGNFDNKK